MPPTAKILLENPDLSQKYASAFAKEAKLKEALKFAVVMYMMVIWTMGKIVLLRSAQVGFSFVTAHNSGLFGTDSASLKDVDLNPED